MKISLSERDENNIVNISIETDPGRASAAYKETARRIGKDITIPGFRKGKAPIKVIETHVGEDKLKADTMNHMFLSELLYDAFREKELDVVFIYGVNSLNFTHPDEAVKIEAQIELYPEVELGDYENLEIEVEIPKFTEEKFLEETLNKIAKQQSIYEEVDEEVQMGDEIIFDYDGRYLENAEKPEDEASWQSLEGMKAEAYQTIVEPGRFIENFLEQTIGMKRDEEKEIEVVFPEKYHMESLQAKKAKFKIKINKISRSKSPEINDGLAKEAGAESLEDLKEKIISEMKKIDESNRKSSAGEALLGKLLEKSVLKVSDAMVRREVEATHKNLQRIYGWDDEMMSRFRESLDMEKEKEIAKDRLLKSVLITSIIRKENLEITEEEMKEALAKLAEDPRMHIDESNLSAIKNKVNMDLLTNKAVELLISKSKVTYIEKEPEQTNQN
jgi:trigger factor